MSDKSILKQYLSEHDPIGAITSKRDEHTESGITENLNAFGWLRGIRDRAVMFEMRQRNGNIIALGYHWLERAEFDPSEGITIFFGGQKIVIKGRNLNAEVRPQVRLFDGILRHRVPWIQEADRSAHLQSNEQDTVITSIDLTGDHN